MLIINTRDCKYDTIASVSLHVYLLEQVSCLFFSFFQRDASTLLKALTREVLRTYSAFPFKSKKVPLKPRT